MKKVFSLFIVIIILFNFSLFSYANTPTITAKSAILIDADSGEILFEKNANTKMYPASTTKMLTGILAIENGNLNEKITVDDRSPYEIRGTHIALNPGEILPFNDILHGLLIESANDCAQVLAKHISGSIESFSKLMNDKAKEIGAINTNFTNPHGLHDSEHTTTAYDLALIARYAMQNETFREIVQTKRYIIEPTNKQPEKRYLSNGNKLLYATGSGNKIRVDGNTVDIKYEGANGVKTGYTPEAMNCLVSSVTKGNKTLIAVVLKSAKTDIWIDSHELFNYGFNYFSTKQVAFKNEFIQNISVENGNIPFVTGILDKDVLVNVSKSRENNINKNVLITEKIKAPVSIGQVLGKIEWTIDDEVVAVSNIVAASESNIIPVKQVLNNVNNKFPIIYIFIIFISLLIILRIYIMLLKKKRKKKRRQYYR